MFFWRTHFAWSVDWEEWDSVHERWNWRTSHFGDYETGQEKWYELKDLPPGKVRNIRLNRRPVGAPTTYLRSS